MHIENILIYWGAFHLMVRPEFLSLYWLKICENLAKMDLLQTWPKFSGYILAPEVRMYCVPFNNLTVLTGLAVLMESIPAWIAPSVRNCSPFWGPVKLFLSSSFQSLLYVMIQRLFYPYSERILYEVQAPNRPRWSNLAQFLPLVRARIVSGHLTENGQFFEKWKFQFFTATPLEMRACSTGRKFAEYDQRGPRLYTRPGRGQTGMILFRS